MKIKTSSVRLAGCGSFSQDTFTFRPCISVQGQVKRSTGSGIATVKEDGSFCFRQCLRRRSEALLLRKLTHGRLSYTKRGDFLITIRVNEHEPNPFDIIADDAASAIGGIIPMRSERRRVA